MAYDQAAIARELAALSASEIVDAAAARGAPRLVRELVERIARVPSRRLGKILAHFDARVAQVGVAAAAREVLERFGAVLDVDGAAPAEGGLLIVMNHPGAYDAFAVIAALRREDVALVASERPFLRALPNLCDHLVFVADSRHSGSDIGRALGLRRALAWLDGGRALVQFGAGAIEPDTRFGCASSGGDALGPWLDGTGVLASRAAALGAAIVPAFVSGVHSRRAKRLAIVRWAERRGITTVAPLIQATVPGFRDVAISVRFGPPVSRDELRTARTNAQRTALLRSAVSALAEQTSK